MDQRFAKPQWQALQMVFELGYLIVIPLIVFGLGGRWLDRQLGTSPWLFLGGMVLAVMATTVFLVRKFTKLLHDINHETSARGGHDHHSNGR